MRRRAWLGALAVALATLAATPAAAPAAPIAIGAYVPDHWKDPTLIDKYAKEVGRMPAIVISYKRWDIKPFYRPELRQINRRGALPMVSWEPWNSAGDSFKLRQIAAGRFDAYLRRSAREARAWGKPIMLRFAHEMNGDWEPWGRGAPGSGSRNFVAAWRHLVTVFREEGADNVLWVWCANVNTGKLPFMQFYPGDRWVDWVGLDGFNWGGSIGWRSFSEVFAGSYEVLAAETSKPILIAETGSGEEDGDKAAWVQNALLRELANFDLVRAVVWFNGVDRSDFRVASSPSALAAFREGIARPQYSGTRAELLATPPARVAGQVAAIQIPSGGYGAPSWLEELWRKLGDRLGAALWPLVGLLVAGSLALVALMTRRRTARADV
ncbi:MAG TPA: glycosyl hydrolase [Solirubrobacterales bacterium]|nr:glycosyl hydrolase [Solirubrobacterales bacterium]